MEFLEFLRCGVNFDCGSGGGENNDDDNDDNDDDDDGDAGATAAIVIVAAVVVLAACAFAVHTWYVLYDGAPPRAHARCQDSPRKATREPAHGAAPGVGHLLRRRVARPLAVYPPASLPRRRTL